MKEEKLHSLYYYFISKRDHMLTGDDGSSAEKFSDFDGIFRPQTSVSAVDGIIYKQSAAPAVDGIWHAQSSVRPADPYPGLVPNFDGNLQEIHIVSEGGNFESNEAAVIGSRLLQIANEFSFAHPTRSVIWFEKQCMVVAPQDRIIFIPVVRSDEDVAKERKFTWETCDKSALADIHYVASSGEVKFGVGETKRNIPIRILTSNDEDSDLRFNVKLTDTCGVFNPVPLTIILKKVDDFHSDEISIIDSLAELQPSSARDTKSILSEHLNPRTFYMGLSFLCSTSDTLQVQFALALELARKCRPKLRDDAILNVLSDFFAQDDIQP